MSHTQRHIPLDAPLVDGISDPLCEACVIVPARNEEAHLVRTLEALRDQKTLSGVLLDPASYEVIVLLNNCTDRSELLARDFAKASPELRLFVACRELPPANAHVGTARRLLMDTAYERLHLSPLPHCAILSTDADTVVAPDWIARNLAAIRAGADVVGGVIHLFPDELEELTRLQPEMMACYQRDRTFQREVARLEAILDPDPADPWPRHLEHFGASLACTPAIYALSGGLPPVKPLEDVAFIDALRKVGARIRHCPDTHIFTSARLDGRAEVGLSGQLRHWQRDAASGHPQQVDSAEWLAHRFSMLGLLRAFNDATLPDLSPFPHEWRARLLAVQAERLPTPRFLELLDCNLLIEEMFVPLGQARTAEIASVLRRFPEALAACESKVLAAV